VRGLNLTVAAGSIYGLLGPNGAGKTTTVRILATLLRPDGGRAAVLGCDVVRDAAAVRRKIALAGQAATVDEDLTGRENLLFLGRLCGLSRNGRRARAAHLPASFVPVSVAVHASRRGRRTRRSREGPVTGLQSR
jgi:ABC-2 type transport system ATP-binding protein